MSEMSQHLAKESSEYNVPINALKNPHSNSTTRLSLPLRTCQGIVYMSEICNNCIQRQSTVNKSKDMMLDYNPSNMNIAAKQCHNVKDQLNFNTFEDISGNCSGCSEMTVSLTFCPSESNLTINVS